MEKDKLTTTPRVVVIGGSAGSLDVILGLISLLPENPAAVIIIVVHRKNDTDSILEELIANKTKLPVREVEDKEPIITNTIYLAPPDYHLLVENQHLFSLDSSEKVHYCRPSIDVTFESVSEAFTSRVIGVLLSGANSDGAQGMARIKERGGYTLVQNPATSTVGFMPQQAVNTLRIDAIADAGEIGQIVKNLLM